MCPRLSYFTFTEEGDSFAVMELEWVRIIFFSCLNAYSPDQAGVIIYSIFLSSILSRVITSSPSLTKTASVVV
mgnify:FL=1